MIERIERIERPLLARHLFGVATSLGGALVLSALVITLNGPAAKAPEKAARLDAELVMAPPKKPDPVQKPAPPRKLEPPARGPRTPRPSLATDLGALGSGLGLFEAPDTGSLKDALLGAERGGAEEMVMTGETVDTQPRPRAGNRPPTVPKEAVQKRLRGHVVLRMVIDAEGVVQDARILESEPRGVFDEAVLQVAPSWRFQPATYKGRPVTLRVDQTIRFDLG